MPRYSLAAWFCLASAPLLSAQTPTVPPAAAASSIHIRKIQEKIRLDGKLEEPVWATLPPITSFTQTEPDLGAPVSERTEALIFYDDDNLYFGFRCYDSQPQNIIHRFGSHDAFTNSDSVDILLDTFHDRRTGYYFSINSRGIQFDAISAEGGDAQGFSGVHDSTWDGIWYSAAALQPWGWSVEVAIPFKSIRLPQSAEQTWGMNLSRSIVRKNENAYWVAVTRFDGTMKPSKGGVVTGLEDIRVGRNLEVIPYGSGRYRRAPWLPPHHGAAGNGGLDVRYGIAQNLTANVTVNPDFAETEADEFTTEISRFEIFFPEKRKFFTEGANYFRTPLNLFFSRRVGARLPDGEPQRILAGAKLTGKASQWTIGALQATTQEVQFTDPVSGLPHSAPSATFAVLRLQRDILQKSAIGLISVNRIQRGIVLDRDGEVIGQRESSHGVDLSILHGEHIRWSSQFMVNLSATYPGVNWQHVGWISQFQYDSEAFGLFARGKFLGRETDLRATGFEPESDRWSGVAEVEFRPFINRWGMRQIFLELNYDQSSGTRGELQDSGADAELRVQFKNFWEGMLRYSYDRVRFNQFTPDFAALPGERLYITPRIWFELSSNRNRRLSFGFRYIGSRMVQFDEKFYGHLKAFELDGNLRLGDHLRWELRAANLREWLLNGNFYQDRRLLASRWTYQFTPKLRARLLGQYSSDIHGHNFGINSLLAYDFTARSALFVGYNRQRNSPLDGADLGNEVFVKLSYLFSF